MIKFFDISTFDIIEEIASDRICFFLHTALYWIIINFLNFREPFEAAQQQEKEKQIQEAAKKVADKTPEKKPSKIVPKKKPDSLDEKNPQESRFEQKHLLDNDTELG